MRAVFLDFGTVSHDDLDTASLERVLPGITLFPTSTEAEVDERIAGVEFILTNKLNITRARMRAVPGLKFIGLTATGTNNIDLEAARELGIAVCNIRDYCTTSVAQHVLGSILSSYAPFSRIWSGGNRRHLVALRTIHRARRTHPRAHRQDPRHRGVRHARSRRGHGPRRTRSVCACWWPSGRAARPRMPARWTRPCASRSMSCCASPMCCRCIAR